MKKLLIFTIVTIIIDQLIKVIVSINMNIADSINIINNFFRITYLQNTGAAWSMFSGNRILLIIITILAVYIIYRFFIKNKKLDSYQKILYGILLGGIIGNLIDRIRLGYVIDYIDVNLLSYNYPVFNIADICIVISLLLLIILDLKEEKNGNKSRR